MGEYSACYGWNGCFAALCDVGVVGARVKAPGAEKELGTAVVVVCYDWNSGKHTIRCTAHATHTALAH